LVKKSKSGIKKMKTSRGKLKQYNKNLTGKKKLKRRGNRPRLTLILVSPR
jgi:hypothetical protein